ncbi:MAG: hypothetical protein K0R17_2946 [Rariglobus sp.]|jgi:hypothetical protein|nr:hypothetical protein [Rariglobus sp.]
MNTAFLDSPVLLPANTSSCTRRLRLPESVVRTSPVERLPGYFISRKGEVESAFKSLRRVREGDCDAAGFLNAGEDFIPNQLSEQDALERLARALKETGQLVVRTADGLVTAWFAGIGDPEDLFLELRPRDAWIDRDELVMGAMCTLADAERLLRSMYQGAAGNELSIDGTALLPAACD